MRNFKGVYAILFAITAFCTSTLAKATDNHFKKDQRIEIFSTGADSHDLQITQLSFVILPVTANVPEICPEDFNVTRKEDARVNYEQLFKLQEKTYDQPIIQSLFKYDKETQLSPLITYSYILNNANYQRHRRSSRQLQNTKQKTNYKSITDDLPPSNETIAPTNTESPIIPDSFVVTVPWQADHSNI